jgi:hypothetical protein
MAIKRKSKEAKHFLVNNTQENSVSLSNTTGINSKSVKAQ